MQDGGPARSYEDYNPPEDNDPSYMDKTRQDDLSPEHHEGNDPESFDFKMPSHKVNILFETLFRIHYYHIEHLIFFRNCKKNTRQFPLQPLS